MILVRIFLMFFFFGCVNDPNLVVEFVIDEHQSVEEILDAELLHTEEGRLRVKIIAEKIERFTKKEPSIIFSENLAIYFYDHFEKIQSTLYSQDAEIDKEKNIMLVYNDVELISCDNKSLETEELIWDQTNNKIYTDKNVKIITGEDTIYGEGFISNPDFTRYEILNIKGTFNFKDTIN